MALPVAAVASELSQGYCEIQQVYGTMVPYAIFCSLATLMTFAVRGFPGYRTKRRYVGHQPP